MAGVPAQWLTTSVTHDATHVSPMSRLKTLARPEGAGRALATYVVPIQGRDEWIAAVERLA